MNYNGDIIDVLDKIDCAFNKNNHLDLFLYVNRLLIGVIDYALANS